MRLTTILILLCALWPAAYAQTGQVVVFTPESLAGVIEERSTSVRLASLEVKDANAGIDIAKDAYLPEIHANLQLGYLGNGYLTDRDFSSGMGIHNPHFVNNFTLEAMQMVYSGGAISGGIRMAELGSKMADVTLRENRQQIQFVLLSKLIDLQCLDKQRDVIEQNITLANQVLDLMRQRISQGLILENDLTRYELQIASLRLQRDRIDESINVASSAISTALGYDEGTRYSLSVNAIDEDYPLQPLAEWRSAAMTENTNISKAKIGIDMSDTRLKIANAERLPHVNVFAYGNLNSPIVTEVPVIDKNFMYWGFGVNVSYSISSLFKTGKKLSQAKLGIIESQERLELVNQAVDDRLTEAYEAFLTAQSSLRTQRYSLRLAEQNYDVVNSRFSEGMALVTDLVDAANVKIAAQTGIENAKSRLLFCLYRLKYISNTL